MYTLFYRAGNGKCLQDDASKDYLEIENQITNDKYLPGENYTEDRQCELIYGSGSKICSYMVCNYLLKFLDFRRKMGLKLYIMFCIFVFPY